MTVHKIKIVCCDNTPAKNSQLVASELSEYELQERLLDTVEQSVEAGAERGLHNAAHHEEHGPVTYVQQVHDGGFAVLVGPPGQLTETFFGPGSMVAFMDDIGPGHGSKVGPDGVKRTLRVLKGHLTLPT